MLQAYECMLIYVFHSHARAIEAGNGASGEALQLIWGLTLGAAIDWRAQTGRGIRLEGSDGAPHLIWGLRRGAAFDWRDSNSSSSDGGGSGGLSVSGGAGGVERAGGTG
eukprot:COSAG01_NODE_4736_length_4783_cov_24.168019_10_plen_108_part_01